MSSQNSRNNVSLNNSMNSMNSGGGLGSVNVRKVNRAASNNSDPQPMGVQTEKLDGFMMH